MLNIFSANVFVVHAIMLIVEEMNFVDCYELLTNLRMDGGSGERGGRGWDKDLA